MTDAAPRPAAGRRLRLTAALLLVLSPATGAVAQSTFYEAYSQGLALERDGDWAAARDAFLAAQRMRPEAAARVKTYGLNFLTAYDPYLHLARCDLHLGRLDDAARHLELAAAAGVSPTAQISQLEEELARQRHATRPTAAPASPPTAATRPPTATVNPTVLRLRSTPSGADVLLDGRLVGVTPVDLPVEPGSYRLLVRLPGYRSASESVALSAGDTVERRLVLEPEPTPRPAVVAPAPTIPATPPAARPTSTPVPPTATAIPTPPVSLPSPAAEETTADRSPAPPDSRPSRRRAGLVLAIAAAVALLVAAVGRWRRRDTDVLAETPTRHLDDPTPTIANATPLPGHVKPEFGSYLLKAVLGRGGMATTYLARRVRDGQLAAVKIPHEHLLESAEFVQRFIREGSLGATIHHPNIIRIFEAGQVDGRPFIAMEYLDGVTLEQRLAARGAMPVGEALETARGIAQALDYAHIKGIVHRDLKPENVMVMGDGGVKVMDYGIARVLDAPGLTATNTYLGTPLYSAPESVFPAEVDPRSDLYSLGIVLYRMLCNRLPFESQSPVRLLELHRKQPLPRFPPELRIPRAVTELVGRLTAKDKSERFQSAEEFLREANQVLNQL